MTPDRLTAALADRYRIERELGQGGMATVYLARDLKHDRDVAIKVLRPELSAVIGAERFLREIKTIANLQHPHILGLIDSGDLDGTAYYVMPFVEGESLRDRLSREKQLPIAEALRLAIEVAGALDYAHRHGVIHRDIKPENIMLHDGQALVTDFGIALAVSRSDGSTRMTETGMSLGTPHYMSPEQAMGERDLDARTDVYALGCVLYEMLAGEPPFTGPTAQAIVAKVMTATPEPLTTYRKTVPPALEDAVHAALQKLPADRFGSAREFIDALQGKSTATPSGFRAARQRTPEGALQASARHPVVWALAALLLAALAFGYREWSALRHAPPDNVVRFSVDLADGNQAALWDSQSPDLAISPDGSTLAFCVINAKGMRQIYVRRMDEALGRVIPGTDGGFVPTFSPDGAFIVFWVAGRFMKVALSGGAPQLVGESSTGVWDAWSPDGTLVYSQTSSPVLMRMPVAGGAAAAGTLDTARGEVGQYYPHALPDGRHVLYASWGTGAVEDVRIGLLDLTSGHARRLDVRGTFPLGMIDGRLVFTDQFGTILAVPLDLKTGEVGGQPVTLDSGVTTAARGSAVAALSASGSLAYSGMGQLSRLVLAAPGSEVPLLTDAHAYSDPRYSPDGRRVAVSIAGGNSSDIWVTDVATGSLTRVTSGDAINDRPEWSPDGRRVVFRRVSSRRSGIWWQPADASAPASPLVASDSADYFEGVITPDGQSVVYQVDTSVSDVMMQRIDGKGAVHPIANTPAIEEQARVSPDGRWVAYVTTGSGNPQVMVQPLPGPGPRVQVSVRSGSEPVWTRDGRHIFYRADDKFWIADVSESPVFHASGQRVFMDDVYLPHVSPHANYDVSPDGTRLLVLKGDRQRLLVVHNWATEARATLAGRGTR